MWYLTFTIQVRKFLSSFIAGVSLNSVESFGCPTIVRPIDFSHKWREFFILLILFAISTRKDTTFFAYMQINGEKVAILV